MESKKRKRESSAHPIVTYDAATRTFDRLFKEDSLDAMKAVVRKKLDISSSVPVFLSQWREGKAVDLEDDEDFEAFSAATRSSESVMVKVFLGENRTQTLPLSEDNETPSTTRRKRKKKSKRDGSVSPPVIEIPSEETSMPDISSEPSEPIPSSKKRRVSFAADAPDLRQILEENSKKQDNTLAEEKSGSPPADTNGPEQPRNEEEPVMKKKKKSKKNKDKQVEGLEEEIGTTSEGLPTSGKESEKKTIADSEATSDKFTVDVGATDSEAPKPKKSKKRSRTSTGVQNEATAEEQSIPASATDENERPAKKAKKKKNAEVAESDASAAAVSSDAATTVNPASELQAPTPQPPSDTTKEEPTKKSRKKKQKTAPNLDVDAVSEAVDSSTKSKIPEDKPTEKPKKSAKSKTANTTSEAAGIQPAESAPPVSNNLTASVVPPVDEPEKAAKKSKTKDKQQTGTIKSIETSSEPKDVPPLTDTDGKAKSKKSKDTEKDSENPVVNVAKDNTISSEPSDAKALKKAGKQKNQGTDVLEQSGAAKDQSTEQANAAQAAAMKEATRLAVLNVLKKAAEKATSAASSSPASGQSISTQPPPMSSESSTGSKAPEIVNPESPLAASSTKVQPPIKIPSSSESTKSIEKSLVSLAKSAKESKTCPICDASPFHARTRCPVIKSGIRAMRKKIADLEQEASEEGADSRASIILELQGIIERRTKKPRASNVTKVATSHDIESESPEKESEVAAVATIPSSAPVSGAEKPVETTIAPPAPPPTNSKLSRGQPISARAILSQKSTQPTLSSHASVSQSMTSVAHTSKTIPSKPTEITKTALGMDLSGFGDMTQFTDKDLDALIRGPRLSIKNALPASETEDESEQEEDVVLEEDVAVEDKLARNASRVEYPSSSDEAEEDEEDEVPANAPTKVDHLPTAAIIEEAVDDDAEKSKGDLSFRDINALGSSVEPDRTADNAVHAAVGADLASINLPGLSQSTGTEKKNENSDETDSEAPSPTEAKAPEKVVEDVDVDPIESSDPLPATQPPLAVDPISSDEEDVPPVESTPKSQVAGRTRSQRTAVIKKVPPKASQPPASQTKATAPKHAPVDDAPKTRTRTLKKITDIPVPPNPAIRVIRQAAVATPRTRRQLAQEKEKEEEETPEEPEVALRTRRAAVVKAKTPAKAPPKTPAKTPARAKTTAKPLSKQGKTTAANGVTADQEHGTSQVPPTSSAKNAPDASWAVLQDSVPSQVDTDNGGQIDELLSSPTIHRHTSPRDHGGKGEKSISINGSQQDPLFIPAESQQSFPYSQYPLDFPPTSQAIASPNDSDDENEVALAVVKAPSAPPKQTYPSLKDIASQSKLFAPRPSQILKQTTEPRDEDLFGRRGGESEESDSGSDSDDDDKRVVSHIPAARRAGVALLKKK